MKHVFISHKVADFDTWKTHFDAHEPKRQEAGMNAINVFRADEDPNDVTVQMEVNDFESARQFASSPDIKEIMEKAGVISQPEVRFLNAV